MNPRSQTELAWSSGGAYEPLMGRWSRLVAAEFVHRLSIPAGREWLDVGCGTGALTRTILEMAAPAAVTGVDRSEEFVAFARERMPDARASFRAADAQQLPFDTGAFDAVVSGLVLNFIPAPARMVAEMARVARPGGVVAFYVWDYAGRMEQLGRFWEAAVALDPGAAARDERRLFPVCRPEALTWLMGAAGLREIGVEPIEIQMEFGSFDDYWRPFLSGQGPSGSYAMSLDEARRSALRDRLQEGMPRSGGFTLAARAWMGRGVK